MTELSPTKQGIKIDSCSDMKYFIKRTSCPICGSSSYEQKCSIPYSSVELSKYIYEFYSNQGSFDFNKLMKACFVAAQCNDCLGVFQLNIPNEIFTAEIYEKWLDPIKTYNLFETKKPVGYYVDYLQGVFRLLTSVGKLPSDIQVFDFGMGWGSWLMLCKGLGCKVFGSELCEARKKHAVGLGIQVLEYSQISQHKFDLININQVLEHVANPYEILIHLKGALAPNGIMRIAVPNGNGIERLLAVMDWTADKSSPNTLNAIAPLEHINCFTPKALRKLVDRAGLTVFNLPNYPRMEILHSPTMEPRLFASINNRVKERMRPIYRKIIPSKAVERDSLSTDIVVKLGRPRF